MNEVGQSIRTICHNMLYSNENEFSVLCDTLLCLSDDEYKFLPLWAGGADDGTGGVFTEDIPSAERGPIGPGPGFHTGSTANSVAFSDFEHVGSSAYSSTMEGYQTSVAVEDGFSDHVDRRHVISEDDFPMEHAALPTRPLGGELTAVTARSGRIFVDGIQIQDSNSAGATVELPVEQPQPSNLPQDASVHVDQDDLSPRENEHGPEFMNDVSGYDSEGTTTEWENVEM